MSLLIVPALVYPNDTNKNSWLQLQVGDLFWSVAKVRRCDNGVGRRLGGGGARSEAVRCESVSRCRACVVVCCRYQSADN